MATKKNNDNTSWAFEVADIEAAETKKKKISSIVKSKFQTEEKLVLAKAKTNKKPRASYGGTSILEGPSIGWKKGMREASDQRGSGEGMASRGKRILASLIDLLFCSSIILIGILISKTAANYNLDYKEITETLKLNYLISVFLYYLCLIRPLIKSSQTLGKSFMKIEVLGPEDESLPLGLALIREIVGKSISVILFPVSLILFFCTSKRRLLHDFIVDTVVVNH